MDHAIVRSSNQSGRIELQRKDGKVERNGLQSMSRRKIQDLPDTTPNTELYVAQSPTPQTFNPTCLNKPIETRRNDFVRVCLDCSHDGGMGLGDKHR
jgi:hypothetical protein